MTMQELIERADEYAKQAISDYNEIAQEFIGKKDERKSAYFSGIEQGWKEALDFLKELIEEEG